MDAATATVRVISMLRRFFMTRSSGPRGGPSMCSHQRGVQMARTLCDGAEMARTRTPTALLASGLSLFAVACAGSRRPAAGERPAEPPCPLVSSARYEGPPIYEDDPVQAPRKRAWEEARGGKEQSRSHVRGRLKGWPRRLLAPRGTLPRDDRAFRSEEHTSELQ